MKTLRIFHQALVLVLFILFGIACNDVEDNKSGHDSSFIDASRVRENIEALGKQFSLEFQNKDSVALANHYASDGMLGSIKGHDNLVSAWNRMIRNASGNGTPNLLFITNSITTDDEYVIELGRARWADTAGNIKREGKYLVVWKKENSEWKIYRDWGL